jgi:hypothetical protein
MLGGSGGGGVGADTTTSTVDCSMIGVLSTTTLAADRKLLAACGVAREVASSDWADEAAAGESKWICTLIKTEAATMRMSTLSVLTPTFAANVLLIWSFLLSS